MSPLCRDVQQRFFKDVPPGSRLRVSLEGSDGAGVMTSSLIAPHPDGDQSLTVACPGQATSDPLDGIRTTYFLRNMIRFLSEDDETMTVELRILSSNGGTHSSAIRCQVTGNKSDGDFSDVWAVFTAGAA